MSLVFLVRFTVLSAQDFVEVVCQVKGLVNLCDKEKGFCMY